MEPKTITIHQKNMYCPKCLANVIKVLSSLGDIKDFHASLSDKQISVTFRDNSIGKKRLQHLINTAITTGMIPAN